MRREAKLVKNKSYIMNLFDRLNPRLKDQLISEEKNFPTTIGAIINTFCILPLLGKNPKDLKEFLNKTFTNRNIYTYILITYGKNNNGRS
jgi:hypothetical protein